MASPGTSDNLLDRSALGVRVRRHRLAGAGRPAADGRGGDDDRRGSPRSHGRTTGALVACTGGAVVTPDLSFGRRPRRALRAAGGISHSRLGSLLLRVRLSGPPGSSRPLRAPAGSIPFSGMGSKSQVARVRGLTPPRASTSRRCWGCGPPRGLCLLRNRALACEREWGFSRREGNLLVGVPSRIDESLNAMEFAPELPSPQRVAVEVQMKPVGRREVGGDQAEQNLGRRMRVYLAPWSSSSTSSASGPTIETQRLLSSRWSQPATNVGASS